MRINGLLPLIIIIMMIIGTGGVIVAQTSADYYISGYFVSVYGQATGPYDEFGLKQLVIQGHLNKDSLVWKEGMLNWVIAGTVEELSPLLSFAIPPPLPLSQLPPPIPNQVPPAAPAKDSYQNFNIGHRWATFGLNYLLPGLGSLVIMRDFAGAGVNMGLGLASIILFSVGSVLIADSYDIWHHCCPV